MAPLSLFQPELFGVTGPKLVHIQQRASGDPEDPHDENYLRETSVSCGPFRLELVRCQLQSIECFSACGTYFLCSI